MSDIIKVSCYCKNPEKQVFIYGNPNIVKCKNCGFVFSDITISLNELKKLYEKYGSKELVQSQIEIDNCKKRLIEIEKIKKNGTILDVGTGDSNFLYIARNMGWIPYGIDSNSSILELHKKNGINVVEKLEELKDEFFDVITMFHVLEHIPQPLEYLKMLKKKLKVGGVLVIDVPNVNSLPIKIFKGDAGYIDKTGKYHIYYYSIQTLSDLLQKAGFNILKKNYKGISGIKQLADIKEKITGSRNVSPLYKYMKPLAFLYMKTSSILHISDCIQIIAIKRK